MNKLFEALKKNKIIIFFVIILCLNVLLYIIPNILPEYAKDKLRLNINALTNFLGYAWAISFIVLIVFFIIIPKSKLRTSQQDYENYKNNISEIFFWGAGFTAFLFGIMISLIAVSDWIHYNDWLNKLTAENSSKEHFIGLAQNILTFVTLLIGLASASIGFLGFIFKRYKESLEKDFNKLKDTDFTKLQDKIYAAEKKLDYDVQKLENDVGKAKKEVNDKINNQEENQNKYLANVQRSVIITTDIALLNLPDITFTQQIPQNLVLALRILDEIFLGSDQNKLLEELLDSDNGVKIRFALAIYRLSRFADNKNKLISDDGKKPSVLSLLKTAFNKLSESEQNNNLIDIRLKRDIIIRLSQTYRQTSDFASAERIIDELGNDEFSDVLKKWTRAIIKLQQGFASKDNLEVRKNCFLQAAGHMIKLFILVYTETPLSKEHPDEINKISNPRYRIFMNNPSLAYYTAKAMLAYKMSFSVSENFNQNCQISGFDGKRYDNLLITSINTSLLLLRKKYEEDNEIESDYFIAAIYNYCIVFLLIVLKKVFAVNPIIETCRKKDDEYWKFECERYLKTCWDYFDILNNFSQVTSKLVYIETEEKISALDDYRNSVKLLENIKNDGTETLINFFRNNDIVISNERRY